MRNTTTLRTLAATAGLAALATFGVVGSAQAQQVAWSVGINSPGVSLGMTNAVPVAVYPRHYYRQEVVYPRYYAAPQAVYYSQPAPVYYAEPAPVYYNTAYAPAVVYPAGYWVGWRQGYVRHNNRWMHPSYVRGNAYGDSHDSGHDNGHGHR